MGEDLWLKLVAVLTIVITGLSVSLKAVVQVLKMRRARRDVEAHPTITGPTPTILTADNIDKVLGDLVEARVEAALKENVPCYRKEGSCYDKAAPDVGKSVEYGRAIYNRVKSLQRSVGDSARNSDILDSEP